MSRKTRSLLLCLIAAALPAVGRSQAKYAGIGPGTYISVGGTFSAFDTDYGHQRTTGGALFLDTNLYRRVGVEVELRAQPIAVQPHTQGTVRLTTFLIGPRISTHGRTWRPYVKLLAGRGQFSFPFDYAHGSYFVAAPGVGLDWRPPARDHDSDRHSRFLIRIVEVEYQVWPDFTYGPLHPYGISTGLSYRLY